MRKIAKLCLIFLCNSMGYAEVDMNNDPELDKELQRLQDEKRTWIESISKKKENKESAAGIVTVINEDEIKRYGGKNLFDVLNRVTSIYMTGSHLWTGSVAAMRGDLSSLINNHTLVLLNGRPLRDSLQGGLNHAVFQDFPIHQIEQLEVIRGSGSVLYGTNAFSSVINIVTKKRKDNALTVRGRYGSFETGQAETEFSWKNENINISGAGRYRESRGGQFSAIDEKSNPIAFHSNDKDVSANLFAEWNDFTLNAFVSNMQSTHWGVLPIGSGQPMEYGRLFVDAGYKITFNPHWNAQWNLTYNHASHHIYAPTAISSTLQHLSEDNVLFEQTHFLKFFDNKLNILVGGLVEWQNGKMTQQAVADPISPYSYLKGSVYGEINYAILDNLKLTMGGQWNRVDYLNQKQVGGLVGKASSGEVGRLGLVYEINADMGIKVLYNQAFRSPSALELEINVPAAIVGNAGLKAERIETLDTQFFYHTTDYDAALTLFRTRQSNLVSRVLLPAPQTGATYVNGGSAVFQGIELETKATFFNDWHWQGAYTFQTNRNEAGQNNATLVPNHIAKLGLSYDITPDLQLSVFDTVFSKAKKYPTAMQVNPPANGYHNITLNANYRLESLLGQNFAKHVTLTMYADNLLNEKIYYPEFNRKRLNTIQGSAGRSVFGEVAIEF